MWRSSVNFVLRFCRSTVSTLAYERQKRKRFLTVNRPVLTHDRQKLTFPIERFQALAAFPFLVIKNPMPCPTPERANPLSAVATAEVGPIAFQEPQVHRRKP
jgi:hypothetical protein